MSKTLPLNTIVIPVFNGGNLLKEAIYSALNQTYTNIEILVVDDGSTDENTKKTIRKFEDSIRIIEKENGGTGSALNVGFQNANGEYVHWLSHDDVYLPGKVASDMHLILNSPEPESTIAISGWHFMDVNRNHLSTRDISSEVAPKLLSNPYWLILLSMANGCTICIPKSLFLHIGNFREDLRTTQDFDYWLRLFPKARIIVGQEINVINRIHGGQGSNLIKEHNQEADDMFLKVIQEAFGSSFDVLQVPRVNAIHRLQEHLAQSNYIKSKKALNEMMGVEQNLFLKFSKDKHNFGTFKEYVQMISDENKGILR